MSVPVERRTIASIFRAAEAKYYRMNASLKQHNDQVKRMNSSNHSDSSDGGGSGNQSRIQQLAAEDQRPAQARRPLACRHPSARGAGHAEHSTRLNCPEHSP